MQYTLLYYFFLPYVLTVFEFILFCCLYILFASIVPTKHVEIYSKEM